MLNKVSELESKLTPKELSDRTDAFSQLRAYLEKAAQAGGVPAYLDKHFPYPPRQTRVDLQVIAGKAGSPIRNRWKTKVELFENFLTDPKQYDAAQNLWQERWHELLLHLGEENLWRAPWLTTSFVNGSEMRDANPIFSAICPERRLAVSIIQVEPSKEPSLRLWTETFAKDEPEEVKVLTIVCVLDEETLSDVIDALHQWIRTGTVRGQMPGIRREPR